MRKRPLKAFLKIEMNRVIFLDSGLGGLPYCRAFLLRNPQAGAVYLADRAAFPYGSKTKAELVSLLSGHFSRLIPRYHPALAALVCNTASVSCLAELRERFPDLPFVGTVPAVKPAVEASRSRLVGVLGTERTIADPYIDELARRYGPDCGIHKIAAPELVEFVEHRYAKADAEERRRTAAPYVEQFRSLGCDGIVLGCTHFLFLLGEFRAAVAASGGDPGMGIYDSVDGVCRRIETLLEEKSLSQGREVPPGPRAPNLLVLTGKDKPEETWQDQAREYGMELRLLEEPEESLEPGEGEKA
jgi:glutamate racemase